MQLFEKTKRKPGINLTPLIDILFILIIFFVVSSKIIGNEGIGIVLPESNLGKEQPLTLPILAVTAEQELLLNEISISKKELASALLNLNSPHSAMILNIDKNIPHGTVIELMDIIKSNGFKKIVFGTRLPSR
ncbi:MAG: biopolymer transporter ExbD [SAR324 cluster bacterium]|nr:biopolymer transporter ExbD [SAR324 cluster bacterium]